MTLLKFPQIKNAIKNNKISNEGTYSYISSVLKSVISLHFFL